MLIFSFIAKFKINKVIFSMLPEDINSKLKTAYRSSHIPAVTKSFLATGVYQAYIYICTDFDVYQKKHSQFCWIFNN